MNKQTLYSYDPLVTQLSGGLSVEIHRKLGDYIHSYVERRNGFRALSMFIDARVPAIDGKYA